MYKITKEFNFSAGHRIVGHKGLCLHEHGHNYILQVSVFSTKLNELGMVMDFSDLKKIVKDKIINYYDHSLILWEEDPILEQIQAINIPGSSKARVRAVPYNPTAENMAEDFCNIIADNILYYSRHKKVSVTVYETPTSSAEYSLEIK